MRRDTGASVLFSGASTAPGRRSRRFLRLLAAVAAAAAPLAGCTQAQQVGESPAYLIVDALGASSGAEPDKVSGTLSSDVITFVKQQVNGQEVRVPTVYADPAEVTFRLGLKDPGTAESPTTPSSANFITLKRYRVTFVRSDGRNTPGVDVPYPFDGGMTGTVTGSGTTMDFTIVRVQAKEEAPLKALAGGGGAVFISTIAEVTFYGTDQAGREVSVTGTISVNFADWGDPD
jgi:hypothetical protein